MPGIDEVDRQFRRTVRLNGVTMEEAKAAAERVEEVARHEAAQEGVLRWIKGHAGFDEVDRLYRRTLPTLEEGAAERAPNERGEFKRFDDHQAELAARVHARLVAAKPGAIVALTEEERVAWEASTRRELPPALSAKDRREVRRQALELAVQGSPPNTCGISGTLAVAREFERYLLGDADDPSVPKPPAKME